MADTFVQTNATFGGRPVIDPRSLYDSASGHGWDTSWFGKPTSYTCPIGGDPGIGWVLLPRETLTGASNSLSLNSAQDLKFIYGKETTTIKNLYIVQAKALYYGPSKQSLNTPDSNNAYLVELADIRRLCKITSVIKSFNIRRPSPHAEPSALLTADQCYAESLNGSSLWTWSTALSWLWMKLPAGVGSMPSLPTGTTIPPEGFQFLGISAWDAIQTMLNHLGLVIKYDPLTAIFSFVDLQSAQSDYRSNINGMASNRMADHAQIAGNAATCPAKIIVCFHRREQHYGTEKETIESGGWHQNAVYSVEKNTGLSGASEKTSLVVWDDLPALVNHEGEVSNNIELQTRASALASQITKRITTALAGKRAAYFGIYSDILPGSEVNYVKWCDDGYSGMYTEYGQEQAPFPPNQAMANAGVMPGGGTGSASGLDLGHFLSRENLLPPDFQRHSFPVFPRLTQLVEVSGESASDPKGKSIPRNAQGVWSGTVCRLNPAANLTQNAAVESVESCWLWAEDLVGGSLEATGTLQVGDRFNGRLTGSVTAQGETRPLYLIRKGGTSSVEGIPFVNEHNSVAPYGAIMQVLGTTTVDGRTHLKVTQPVVSTTDVSSRQDVPRIFVVNKSSDVGYQQTGVCTKGPFVELLVDIGTDNAYDKPGTQVGPTDASWSASPFSLFPVCSLDHTTQDGLGWGWLYPLVFLKGRIQNSSSGVLTVNTDQTVEVIILTGKYLLTATNRMSALRIPANSSRNVFVYRHENTWVVTGIQC